MSAHLSRRVPHVQTAVASAPVAIVSGFGAWWLGRLLREGRFRMELESIASRSALSPEQRDEVARTLAAIDQAGSAWFIGRGGSAVPEPGLEIQSSVRDAREHGGSISAQDAAVLLGVSDRAVRKAAAAGRLLGRRGRVGWEFTVEEIEAERDRRTKGLHNAAA